MVNKIYPGERAVRVGRFKFRLCEYKEGCDQIIPIRGKKYCKAHSQKMRRRGGSSGKIRDPIGRAHGEKFRILWDKLWGLEPI